MAVSGAESGSIVDQAILVLALASAYRFHWARVWMISGTPVLSFLLLARHRRAIWQQQRPTRAPPLPLSALLLLVNLACAAASTTWLIYWPFTAICWAVTLVLALSRYSTLADFLRRRLRRVLRHLQFTADKIALFDLPALEIDVDVSGLLVIRGITVSLSSLTIEAHGVEVGIKLSDDMELAIQTDKVTVALFRQISVSDVYANIKGGIYEMTFGHLDKNTHDSHGNALMDDDTPLLKAAASWSSQEASQWHEPGKVKMTDKMTNGHSPSATSAQKGVAATTKLILDDDQAGLHYKETMNHISRTSEITMARRNVNRLAVERAQVGGETVDVDNLSHVRAAVCSMLHDKASIQHPPKRSVRVTTLRSMSSPRQRRFMHRLPMLLRLLLNPLAYFHPLHISSVTATASGRWMQSMLGTKVFQDYAEQSSDIRKLRQRVFSWLSDANFAVQLANITASAQVPFIPDYEIHCRLLLEDIVAYRTLPREIRLTEVVNLRGADATVYIPSFLLPHHEHLLPSKKARAEEAAKQRIALKKADSMSKVVQAKNFIEQDEKDETNCRISAHARLPARFDQELLNFVAALVKATKIIEFEKDDDDEEHDDHDSIHEVHGFREFSRVLSNNMKDGLKKATINAAANDRWIAKLVGKITKKLQVLQGDVGYSGNIPVALAPYRAKAESASKLLP